MDLFATEYNFKIRHYVASNLDPQVLATDALSLDWNQWNAIYLFPPVNCLLKVLHKLQTFKGRVVLVTPNWPKSNWFPPPVGVTTQVNSDTEPRLITKSANQDCFRFLLASPEIGFMNFLNFAARRRFNVDPDNISFTESDKLDSTIRQHGGMSLVVSPRVQY